MTEGEPTRLVAVFASTNGEFTVRATTTDIAPYAFVGSGVTSVDMSASAVDTIWHGAFENVTSLTSVKFSTTLTTIYFNAFSGCTGLTKLELPANLTTVWNYAFANCTGLTEVTIPAKLTMIYNYAFANCTGITELTIPQTVTTIYENAFAGWTSEQTIKAYYTATGAISSYHYGLKDNYGEATIVWMER